LHEADKRRAAYSFSFSNLQEKQVQYYGFGPSISLIVSTLT